jgi:hypothetical protein
MLIVLTLYQKIHSNQMQGQLIPHRLTGTTSLRSLQDGLPKSHEWSVTLLDLYGIYLAHLLTGNRQHWRLTRPVSLLNLPVTPIILVTPAPVPVALDRPVALNRNQESLDPLNQMQGPLTASVAHQRPSDSQRSVRVASVARQRPSDAQ